MQHFSSNKPVPHGNSTSPARVVQGQPGGSNGSTWRAGAPRPSGSRDDTQINLAEIWEVIREGKWIILLSTVLCTAAAVAYTATVEPTYEASSIVAIDARESPATSLTSFVDNRDLASEVGLLSYSVELAERVVGRLQEASEEVGTDEYFPVLQSAEQGGGSVRSTAMRLMRHVRFQPYESQGMIGIVVSSSVPEEAATIANLYAEEYQAYTRESSRASIAAARRFLEDQVEKRARELENLESQWVTFARDRDVVVQGQQGEALVEQYTSLETRRSETQYELERERFTLEQLQRRLEEAEPTLEDRVQQERVAAELEQQIQAIDQRLAELKISAETYYANNPGLRGDSERIARDFPELASTNNLIDQLSERKTQLTEEYVERMRGVDAGTEAGGELGYVARLRESIAEKRMTVQALEAQLEVLDTQIARLDGQLHSVPRQAIENEQLERRRMLAEKWYTTSLEQLQQTLVAEESELGYVRLVRSAFVPSVPVEPNTRQNILLGILLGLGCGIGLSFIRVAFGQQFSKPEDLRTEGYNPVGVVPYMDPDIRAIFGRKESVEVDGKLVSTRLMTLHDPWSPISESFRLIRTNISYINPEQPVEVLMITSPEQADGKSVTSVNLAITMAQSGRRVLVVDADMRRPSAHRLLGMPRDPGLGEILSGKEDFTPERFRTSIDNLSFVPAGFVDTPPPELLGSDRLHAFIREARRTYDTVIVDTPPVLMVSDALVLAPSCDAALIVVSADKTDLRALEVAEGTLSSLGIPILGTVVNRFDARKARGYAYGFGYGYYSEYGRH